MDFRYYPLRVRAYVTEGFTIPSEDATSKALRSGALFVRRFQTACGGAEKERYVDVFRMGWVEIMMSML